MSRYHSARHFRPHRRRRPKKTETIFETAKRYGFIAVLSGLGIAYGTNASDNAQKRQAILEALPAGYTYSGCDEVRAAGVAPIYSSERGFSDRLDGDGDGVGCEPYRGQ
ncbi:excalibur calcium-binding domain-containing protein [Novosphingopyxis iocasae]|uniref:excalibur calcium-binding domain-containing protein n=1 Tax=Novosphingopyxis iocasae TaxID=2762729 RepID=UPI001650FB5E